MTEMETETPVTETEEQNAASQVDETTVTEQGDEAMSETEQELTQILETLEEAGADEEGEALSEEEQGDVDAIAEAAQEAEAEAAEEAEQLPPLTEEERHALQLRVVEALLFAAAAPLDEKTIKLHLQRGPAGEGADVKAILGELKEQFKTRGVELAESSGRYSLRSARDLGDYLHTESVKPVKLSRAMSETLAIIAYHQPVTRAEVETIRGVATSKGTLDYLMMLGWVRPGRRRETPGRPLTWITTPAFLDHFGLGSVGDLPGMEELRAAGLLDAQAATTYGVLAPSEDAELPPAVESLVESEPEFLPSEETVAEQLEAAKGEEVAEDTIVASAEDADDSNDEDDFDDEDGDDELASDDDADDEDESDDDEIASDDDSDDEDDEDDDAYGEDTDSEEMSDDDDFDDDDDDFDDDDEDEPTINSASESVADEVEAADIDAEEPAEEDEKQFA